MAAASSPDPIATITGGIKRLTDVIEQIVTQAVRQVQAVLTRVVEVVTRVVEVAKRVVTQIVSILLPGPPANQSPVVAVATVSLPDPGTGVVTGMVSASDPDGDPVTFTAPAGTAKGTVSVDSSSGAFIYTPTEAARHAAAADGVSAADRSDTFTVTVVDGRGGSTAVQVALAVAPANTAPEAGVAVVGAPDPATGVVTGTVIAGDPDGDALTFTAPASTAKGTVAVDFSSGAFTYTPTAAARESAAQSGATPADKADTLTVTVADGHGGLTAVPISVVISPATANQSPVAVATVSLPDPGTGVVTGMVSASDPDGDPVTFTAPAGTPKGTVSIDPNTGAFTYTPTTAARDAAAREFAIRTSTAALPSVSDLLGSVRLIPETTLAYVDTYDANTGNYSIAVFDFTTNAVIATVPFTTPNTQTDHIVVNSDGTRAYVTTITYDDAAVRSDKVSWIGLSVIDTKLHAIIDTIPFAANAGINGIAINPEGTRLYVPTYNYGVEPSGELAWGSSSMTVIDTSTATIIATVPFPGTSAQGTFADPGFGPVAVNPAGTRVYVETRYADEATSEALSAFSIIDTATNTIVGAIDYPERDTFMRRMTFSPDGTRLYVDSCSDVQCDGTTNTMIVLNTVTDTVTDPIAHPADPGSTPWVGDQAISPDGRYLYVAATDEIFDDYGDLYARTGSIKVIDTATSAIIGTIGFPPDVSLDYDTYPVGIALSADGTRLHVITETTTYQNGDNSVTGAAVLTYDIDQAALTARSDTFTVTVSDGRGGSTAVPVAVAITADPQGGDDGADNRAPTPGAPTLSIDPITGVVTGSVNAVDPDGDSLTYEAVTAITGKGIVDVTATGQLTYTPSDPARHAAAWVQAPVADKTDSIAVTVTDIHGATAIISIALPISPQNTAPTGQVALNPFYLPDSTPYGTANPYNGRVYGTLTAADADYDFPTVTATVAKGTVVFSGQPYSGGGYYDFTYTPTADARAAAGAADAQEADKTDSVSITIHDGFGGTATVSVSVKIAPTTVGQVITFDAPPRSVALTPDGQRAYVTTSDSVQVVNTLTNTIIASVPFDSAPALSVRPDGRRVYATYDDRVAVIDNATGKVVDEMNFADFASVLAFSADSSRAFIATGTGTVLVDLTDDNDSVLRTFDGPQRLDSVVASHVDQNAYAFQDGQLAMIDSTTGDVSTIPTGSFDLNGYQIADVSSDGRNLYLVNWNANWDWGTTVAVVDTTQSHVSVRTAEFFSADAADFVVSPSGDKLHVVDERPFYAAKRTWLAVIDDNTDTVLRIAAPSYHNYSLSADGTTVYAGTAAYDSMTGKITGVIPGEGRDVAAVGSGGRVYLTDPTNDTVTILHPQPVDPVADLAETYDIGFGTNAAIQAISVQPGRRTLWVLSSESYRIQDVDVPYSALTRFDPTSQQLQRTILPRLVKGGILTVGNDGNVFVGDSYGTSDKIQMVSPEGEFVRDIPIGGDSETFPQGLATGNDGRIYIRRSDYGVTVLNPDGSLSTSLAGVGGALAVGPDDRIYLSDGNIINPDNSVSVSPPNGYVDPYWPASNAVMDSSYRVWYTSVDGFRSYPGEHGYAPSLRVQDIGNHPFLADQIPLRSDGTLGFTSGPYLGEGAGRGFQLALGPDGLVYSTATIAAGHVSVVDPTQYSTRNIYSMGAIDITLPNDVAVSASNDVYVAGYKDVQLPDGSVTSYPYVAAFGPRDSSTPAEPIQMDASYARLGFGPEFVQGLWANVFDNATGVNDGVLVQTVRGQDGLTRAIAYIGGTTGEWGLNPEDNQGIFENAISRLGVPKDDQVASIKAEITRCEASPSCGPVEEVLLVGYSQGGMDAQNLAFWNALGTPIAGVVTFGSPIIAANPAVTSLHIQDSFDGVVISEDALASRLALNPATLLLLEGPKAWAQLHGDIYKARSGTPVNSLLPFGEGSVHSNRDTYLTLSEWFTDSAESEYATQKTVVSRFLGGTLIGQSPPTPALFGNAV